MMHWVWTILIGLLVGVVAKFFVSGGPSGFIMTAVLGIAGSVVATFLGQALGLYAAGGAAGFIASVIGAILLVLVYRAVTKGR